jgi:F-type H+-transporting ATPase subunit b
LETILDAVNDRRRNQNALLSAENARKEMQTTDNQRILQEARMERDNMLKCT